MNTELSFEDSRVLIITFTTQPYHRDSPRDWDYTITPLTKKQLKLVSIDTRSYHSKDNALKHEFGQDYLEECVRIK